jgi:hypothetical protein
MIRLFEALYLSEVWYGYWRSKGSVYAKARAMVLFDRVMANEDRRIVSYADAAGRTK